MKPKKSQTISFEQKKKLKLALQKACEWTPDSKQALLVVPEVQHSEMLTVLLPALASQNVQVLFCNPPAHIAKACEEYYHLAALPDTWSPAQALEAADMCLFVDDPSMHSELYTCLKHGAVPIAPATPSLRDYNPVQEKGNSFCYHKADSWSVFASVVRTLETYHFPYDYKIIQRQCNKDAAKIEAAG
jgi:hypothetical protein